MNKGTGVFLNEIDMRTGVVSNKTEIPLVWSIDSDRDYVFICVDEDINIHLDTDYYFIEVNHGDQCYGFDNASYGFIASKGKLSARSLMFNKLSGMIVIKEQVK